MIQVQDHEAGTQLLVIREAGQGHHFIELEGGKVPFQDELLTPEEYEEEHVRHDEVVGVVEVL